MQSLSPALWNKFHSSYALNRNSNRYIYSVPAILRQRRYAGFVRFWFRLNSSSFILSNSAYGYTESHCLMIDFPETDVNIRHAKHFFDKVRQISPSNFILSQNVTDFDKKNKNIQLFILHILDDVTDVAVEGKAKAIQRSCCNCLAVLHTVNGVRGKPKLINQLIFGYPLFQ